MKSSSAGFVIFTLSLLIGLTSSPQSSNATALPESTFQEKGGKLLDPCEFRSAMRKLWEEHISWTRLFIISDAANLADKATTTQRLLKNQEDIGNAIVPFYGQQAGLKLTQLLKTHILIAAKLVDAAKTSDNALIQATSEQWKENADEIAQFLATANPRNWELSEMKEMLHKHLQLTTSEAINYLKGNYSASVVDFDQVETQALSMADGLSNGIMWQFPQLFKR